MLIDDPLVLSCNEGAAPGTLIFHFAGPVTLRNLFDMQAHLRSGDPPQIAILDLSGVPYMDSAGLGAIVNYYVHCQKKGARLIIASVSSRVMELFKMTHVDRIMSFAPSVEKAEASL